MTLADDALIALYRAGLLLLPCLAAAVLLVAVKPTPREAAAAMVAFLWQLPALLVLHLLATALGWWSFAHAGRNALLGMPIDVWIGWAVWWGPVAALLSQRVPIGAIVVAAALVDAVAMPLLAPLVVLAPGWFAGEVPALAIGLVPGLLAARMTRDDRLPHLRAAFHMLGWGGYLFLVIPACILAYEGSSLRALYEPPAGAADWALLAALASLTFVGIMATVEFAVVGSGTPIPLDPPKRVVTSGPYAFLANPMQVISAALMALLALRAGSWGMALAAGMFLVFDGVYASWYNRAHIARAMPAAWSGYKDAVPDWRPRWRPYIDGSATVTISASGPARWIWDRLWRHVPDGVRSSITVLTHPRHSGRRLEYLRADAGIAAGGMAAASRLLDHGPAPLAALGWLLRFPVLGTVLQAATGLMVKSWQRLDGGRTR